MNIRKLFGECQLIREWLAKKSPRSVWFPLKLLDAILRGFSQVRPQLFSSRECEFLMLDYWLGP